MLVVCFLRKQGLIEEDINNHERLSTWPLPGRQLFVGVGAL